MRSFDFLKEAALAPKTFYVKDRLQNLINRLKKKDDFLTTDGEYIKVPATSAEIKELITLLSTNYDAQGTVISNKRMPNVIGGVPLSKLMKTADFGGKAGVGASGEQVGSPNIGPTVEALKSMAIFAKLINRGKAAITVEDVQKVAKIMLENAQDVREKGKTVSTTSSSYSRKVYDLSKKVQDTVSIDIRLSTPPFLRAVNVSPQDKKAWGTLQGIVNYVNSESDVGKYSRYFASNNVRDPLNIGVVGISGAKTDILTTRTMPDGTERPLSNLSMSIKAGSSMYDQASGMNVEGITKFYEILGLSKFDAQEAIEASGFIGKTKGQEDTAKTAKDRVKAVTDIYRIAAEQLNSELIKLNDKGEADYVTRFLNRLRSSIEGEGRLVYVNFDAKGTYNKLNPMQITSLARHIELGVELDIGSKATPYLYIVDRLSGKPIMHVRLAILKSGRMTHTFELDYLLDLIRDAKKAEKQEPAPQATPAPQAGKPVNLGPSNAVPAKVPTKQKSLEPITAQPPKKVGEPMGKEPEQI